MTRPLPGFWNPFSDLRPGCPGCIVQATAAGDLFPGAGRRLSRPAVLPCGLSREPPLRVAQGPRRRSLAPEVDPLKPCQQAPAGAARGGEGRLSGHALCRLRAESKKKGGEPRQQPLDCAPDKRVLEGFTGNY